MAIKVVDLVMSLRYALGDMQGINISDYELIEPINQAAHKLYGYLSERHVREVVAEKEVTLANDGAEETLDDSFIRICQVLGSEEQSPTDNDYKVIIPTTNRRIVFGAYRLVGRKFKSAKGKYIIEYYYIPKKVDTLADILDVPESMRRWIEQVSLAYYRKDYNTVEGIAQQCESVLAGREIPRFENANPAQTLGARGAAQ